MEEHSKKTLPEVEAGAMDVTSLQLSVGLHTYRISVVITDCECCLHLVMVRLSFCIIIRAELNQPALIGNEEFRVMREMPNRYLKKPLKHAHKILIKVSNKLQVIEWLAHACKTY